MKALLILLTSLSLSICANELSWVDEQVNAIKPNRSGVSNTNISKLTSPFVYLKKNLPEGTKLSKKTDRTKDVKSKKTRNPNIYSSNKRSSIRISNSNYKLNAIINSAALINGKWYKLGDRLHGYKIVKISKTSVTLSRNNKKTVLSTNTSAKKLNFK